MSNNVKSLFFPANNRGFIGKRWLMISLRTLHLVGICGIGANFLFELSIEQSHSYLYLTFFSGIAMVLIELWSNGVWLLQLKGMAIVVKLLLIGAMLWWPNYSAVLFIAAVIISGISSHAPGYIRYYSVWHRRRI